MLFVNIHPVAVIAVVYKVNGLIAGLSGNSKRFLNFMQKIPLQFRFYQKL